MPLVIRFGSSDEDVASQVIELLQNAGHTVHWVRARDQLLQEAMKESTDLVVLDARSPGFSEAALIERVRLSRPSLAVMLLTSLGDLEQRVRGLDSGADDCLEVPFAPSQMVARVGALGRRITRESPAPEILEIDGCTLDLGLHLATRDGRSDSLTAREVGVLRWLHTHRARAVSRAELLQHVWRLPSQLETRSVDVAIGVLRRKIERTPSKPRIILSVRGAGYRWGG
jgi:two-component system response regulator RegX3